MADAGVPSIVQRDRLEQFTVPRREMAAVLTEVDREVPPDAPLGLVHDEDSWDYPIFGSNLERRVMLLTTEQAN